MQINFLNIPQIYKLPKSSISNNEKIKFNPQLRTDTVSFSGNNDLLNLSNEEIIEKIKISITNPKNFIGEGSEAKVYKIENSSYCVRLNYLDSKKFNKTSLCRNINDADKVNHIVAKLGKYSSIMRYIDGYPVLSEETTYT